MEREKILAKLDIRGAKAARLLSRSLRAIAKSLAVPAEASIDPERATAGARLVLLRRDALRLMSSGSGALTAAEIAELEKPDPVEDDDGPSTLDRAVPDDDDGPATIERAVPTSQDGRATLVEEVSSSKERPTLSPPGPDPTSRRRADDEITGAHTPESLRAQSPRPKPGAGAAGGLGDYIARIRKLKG